MNWKEKIAIIVMGLSVLILVISGLSEFLGLIFIVLKLIDYIDWSWWYVLMPIYLPLISLMMLFASHAYLEKEINK